MKKILPAAVALFLFVNSFAQNLLDNKNFTHLITFNSPKKNSGTRYYKTIVSDWYQPINFALKDPVIGNSLQYSIGLLQHDSLAKITDSNGTVTHNSWLSAGRVLDPKDTIISLTNNPSQRLSGYVSYTLDSVRFTYAYVRNTDSLPDGISGNNFSVTDTLFIHYFMGNEIGKSQLYPSQNKYATVEWKGDSTRMPQNYFATDTVLLRQSDSTGISNINGNFENFIHLKTYVRKAPTGLTINANNNSNINNLIAYTFSFISAVPTVKGTDTAMMLYQKNPATLPAGTRRTNYFGFYYAINQDSLSWPNPAYYNTSLMSPWWCAYGEGNDWYGFVPGNAYTHEYFIDADFHLTTSANADVKEITNGNFAMSNIYPNPAKAQQGAFIGFNLKTSSEVKVEIYNLTGQRVKTVLNKKFDAGENGFDMNLYGISCGIYFVNLSVNGFTQTKKLVIAE